MVILGVKASLEAMRVWIFWVWGRVGVGVGGGWETTQQIAVPHGIPWISGKRQPPSVHILCIYAYTICTYIYIYIDKYIYIYMPPI